LSLSLIASFAAGAAAADPPATTTTAAAPPQTAAAPPKKHGFDPNTVICKRETPTGTRIGGEEICLTWAQWDQVRRQDVDALRRIQQAPTSTSMGGGMGR
jgi:hypothetical protein